MSAEAAAVRQPAPFPLPVTRSACRRRSVKTSPLPTVIESAGYLRRHSARKPQQPRMRQEGVEVRCLRSVLPTRMAPSPPLTMVKSRWIVKGDF